MDAAPDHVSEVAEILALGLVRLLARKSSELLKTSGETSLDFSVPQSGHPEPSRPEKYR